MRSGRRLIGLSATVHATRLDWDSEIFESVSGLQ